MSPQHFDRSLAAAAPENYERFFDPAIGKPLADNLIDVALLQPGEHVLDVGCGTGVVTRLAAERVGPDGSVTGLDLNPGMLAVARSVASPELNITWREASAESMPLPDAGFDVVLCQLSLQFVPDRKAAVSEMHRVLRPGGRLVITVPGPVGPLFEQLAVAMGKHIAPQAAGFVRAVFSIDDATELENLLAQAGFRDVNAEAEVLDLPLPEPKEFLWQYVAGTPLAATVANADEDARSALEREVVEGWQQYRNGDGMNYRQRVLTATGRH